MLEVAKLLRKKRIKIMDTHKGRALMKDERTVRFLDRQNMDYQDIQRQIIRFNSNAKKFYRMSVKELSQVNTLHNIKNT